MIFDKRLLWTGLGLAAVTTWAIVLAQVPEPVETMPSGETLTNVERQGPVQAPEEESESPVETEYQYVLGEHQGRLAVYLPGQEEPEMVLEFLVKYLPDYDQAQLSQGIEVADYQALVALIEDYIS